MPLCAVTAGGRVTEMLSCVAALLLTASHGFCLWRCQDMGSPGRKLKSWEILPLSLAIVAEGPCSQALQGRGRQEPGSIRHRALQELKCQSHLRVLGIAKCCCGLAWPSCGVEQCAGSTGLAAQRDPRLSYGEQPLGSRRSPGCPSLWTAGRSHHPSSPGLPQPLQEGSDPLCLLNPGFHGTAHR